VKVPVLPRAASILAGFSNLLHISTEALAFDVGGVPALFKSKPEIYSFIQGKQQSVCILKSYPEIIGVLF
jgi:hypothetical protein